MTNQHQKKRAFHRCECGDHSWCQLTRGYVVLVSPDDVADVGRWSWSTLCLPDGKRRAVRRENASGTMFYMHRQILAAADGDVVDHKNANGLDNRRGNIRVCRQAENVRNQRPQRRRVSSRYKGVYHDKTRGQWQAYVNKDGKRYRLGRFASEVEAAEAYDAKAAELHGEFALTNKQLGLLP